MLCRYLIVFLLSFLFLLKTYDAKTVTFTDYVNKTKYTKTKTHSASPATVVVYKSTTAKTLTSTIIQSTTSKPPAKVTSSIKSYVYIHKTSTLTATNVMKKTASKFKTYTVQ